MKKIIILSHLYPEKICEINPNISLREMHQKNNANFEWKLIDALSVHKDVKITLVNQIILEPKKLKIDCFTFKTNNPKIDAINIAQNFKKRIIRRNYDLLSFYKKNKSMFYDCDAIIFSTYNDALSFKKILPKCKKKAVILPDLPDFCVGKTSFLNRMYRKYLTYQFYKNIKHINYVLPITASMMEKLPNKNFEVVDGVYEYGFEDVNQIEKEPTFLYAGALNEKYGVVDLINAFKICKCKDKFKLNIAGSGSLLTKIKTIKEVNYIGILKKEDCLKEEMKASLLIVPENGKNKYAKYSFHSKILEYLCSGTPVLLFYYDGITNDLLPYLNFIEVDSRDNYETSIAKGIERAVNSLDELEEKSKSAKKYLKATRSKEAISRKIYNLLFNK